MKLPILDLRAQYAGIRDEINQSIQLVLDSQIFILGQEVDKLEEEIADYCGTKYAIGVASGTDAIMLSLKSLGIGQGDEVITTPFTFIATAEPIVQLGARPVFVDIDPKTYNMDPRLIERVITEKTKAIIPVHLYGQCADMDPIIEVAKRHKMYIVEDSAQAIGAEYKDRRAASMGDIAAISFFPSKNLGGFGDGGIVTTNNEELRDKIRLLRLHGSREKYVHTVVGHNSRLDNLQAAVLRVKFRYLDKWLERRADNAQYYNKELEGLPVITSYAAPYNRHTYHMYVLRVPSDAKGLMGFLKDNGIETRTYYPIPLHLQECFNYLGYKQGDFPEAEKACKVTFAIPIYPELEKHQMDYIIEKIKTFFKSK